MNAKDYWLKLRYYFLKRKEGHIDLAPILRLSDEMLSQISADDFKSLYDYLELQNKNDVRVLTRINGAKLLFSFPMFGERFYFKYDWTASSYNELVMEEILKDLQILCAHYDLAIIGNIKGAISKNYKDPNCRYINGLNIIKESGIYESYGYNEEWESSLPDALKYRRCNNLEDIWAALEIRYQNRVDGIQIVANLMQKVVDMFLFGILTGQGDYHLENWEIVEYPDGRVDFQILFDNERFLKDADIMLGVRHDDFPAKCLVAGASLRKSLEAFQKISSCEFTSILESWLWVIEEENLKKIFARIEAKTKWPMPLDLQNELLNKFEEHRVFLVSELNNNSGIRR
ncbi:MAG: hypothetical protein K2M17_04350 [Bacilli bacterium]|nr:hypothetical protein [Bacilli bacterium]